MGRKRDENRESDMRSRFANGESMASIAMSYNISRERVRQILARLGIKARQPKKAA